MTSKREDLVHVQLKLQRSMTPHSGNRRDHLVALMGPVRKANYLELDRPQRCVPTGFNNWIKDIWVLKNTVIFFKFALIQSQSLAIVETECINAHRAFIGLRPLIIECTFNEQGIVTQQVHERPVKRQNRMGLCGRTSRIPKLSGIFSDRRERMMVSSNITIEESIENKNGADNKQSNKKGSSAKVIATNEKDVTDDNANTLLHEKERSSLNRTNRYVLAAGFLVTASLAVYTFMQCKK